MKSIEAFGSFAQKLGRKDFVTLCEDSEDRGPSAPQCIDVSNEPELPNAHNYSLMTYMAGMYLRDRILRDGWEATIAWATPLANGSIEKVLKKLSPFLPSKACREADK